MANTVQQTFDAGAGLFRLKNLKADYSPGTPAPSSTKTPGQSGPAMYPGTPGTNQVIPGAPNHRPDRLGASIYNQLQRMPHSLFRKDLDYWHNARSYALNPYTPRRWQLYEMYMDVMNDLHLSSVVEKRILKLTNRKIKLVDDQGNKDEKATKAFNKKWFRKSLRHYAESKFYGFSLLEFTFNKKDIVEGVTLIDRRYVAPEFNMFLVNPGNFIGYKYNEFPYATTALGAGEPDDLGLLLKLSICGMLKRNALGNWSEFVEIFGVPIRTVKANTTDPDLKKQIEDMLESMGSSLWGLFPEEVELEILEPKMAKDSSRTFEAFIDLLNAEISKSVLGQTMTTDGGESRSQGEVHERAEMDIMDNDAIDALAWCNDNLIPFLQQHNYKLDGLSIEWDESEELNMMDRSKVDLAISQMGMRFTKKYIEETYGVELEEAVDPMEEGQPGEIFHDPGAGADAKADKARSAKGTPKTAKTPKSPKTVAVAFPDITAEIREAYI